jgi:excisionase family DNA binding protein
VSSMTNKQPKDARPTEHKLLLTITEVSEMLNLARSYVYAALITTETLPSIKLGRRRLVARRDLEAYVEQLREQGGAA